MMAVSGGGGRPAWRSRWARVRVASGRRRMNRARAPCGAIGAGEIPGAPMAELLGLESVEAERRPGGVRGRAGRVSLQRRPASVHGGLAATLLDSAMGCAVHSTLPAGVAYTTLELKVNFTRAITRDTGRVVCRGAGAAPRRAGRHRRGARDRRPRTGKLLAHGTTTCLHPRRRTGSSLARYPCRDGHHRPAGSRGLRRPRGAPRARWRSSTPPPRTPRCTRWRTRSSAARRRSSRPTRATWRPASEAGLHARPARPARADRGAAGGHRVRRARRSRRCPTRSGETIEGCRLPNGLDVRRVRVPLGVVAVVYEARPNVTIDCSALCLKSGNAIVLRGLVDGGALERRAGPGRRDGGRRRGRARGRDLDRRRRRPRRAARSSPPRTAWST